MKVILLVLQFSVVILLSVLILLQKTNNDGLSGLAGGGHNLISNKTGNALFTKVTMFLAVIFMLNSVLIARVTKQENESSIVETIEQSQEEQRDIPKAE